MEQGVSISEAGLENVASPSAVKRGQSRTGRVSDLGLRISDSCRGADLQSAIINPRPIVLHNSGTIELLIRLFDILGSLIILVCALPVMVIFGLLVKLTSRGPVLYRQERVGKGGVIFTLYKFRTMIDDAERYIGPVLASRDDERITSVGRFLRCMRLDELPQLYNILRGDMSLVGPRPERPYFVARDKALQGARLTVKPGLTGLAQVRSFYDLKPAHKVRYDYLYIQNRSLLLNIYILLRTIPTLFAKKGW
jgi:lipopolysaccharide/colanic/teichoic acid biosynthesis glycosyltransferase